MTESNVQPFEFRGNPVATVTTGNGTVLFCAKHVATALGYKRPADAVKQHCKGSVIRRPLETAGGIQQMVFITEGDVYRLIASSKLTSAVEFEHWLFDEVVPQIRRTGGYIPQGETPEETMARAVLIAQKTIGNPNMPTQKSMELGLFEVKETSIAHSDGHVSLNFTTKVTPKGQQYLIQKYLGCTPLDLEAGA